MADTEGGGFSFECVAFDIKALGADWEGEVEEDGKEAFV
jgi:hypothetical protein